VIFLIAVFEIVDKCFVEAEDNSLLVLMEFTLV
jgi:hypothetical protein